jgi:hypothetical protein
MFPAVIFVLLAALAAPSQRATFTVPNFHDLTLKIRRTTGLMQPQVTTWYLKGPRERVEHSPDNPSPNFVPFAATIMQCDQRTLIHLNVREKSYISSVSHHPESSNIERPKRPPQSTGPEVVVTINSVDTGERREVAGYEARHIRTTVTVEPSAGAATKPSNAEADSWYLDLPGLYCVAGAPRVFVQQFMGSLIVPSAHHDRLVFKHVGIEPYGLVIEENSTQHSEGNVIVGKTELLESSDQPLDESLFEIPGDFTPREPGRPLHDRTAPESDTQ